jgi:hypothetical protein
LLLSIRSRIAKSAPFSLKFMDFFLLFSNSN